MKVKIVGAGIAGLSAGIALKLKGFDVEILEKANRLEEVGAGLQVSPNGSKIINALGVTLKGEFEPESVVMRMGDTGKDVFTIPMREFARKRWGAPYFNIARADFQNALLERAQELNVPISTGQNLGLDELKSLRDDLKSENGLLIGADGVHSPTRKLLYPNSKPKFSKNVAYRALIPLELLNSPPAPSAVIWAGHKKHAVTTRVDYGNIVNFVGVCEENDWQEDGWNHQIDPALVRKKFEKWHPSIYEALKHVTEINRWALLYHPKLPSFVRDNVVLIGDAAHPMLPSFAQGAVQSLEDAYILAECLSQGRLDIFDKIRLPRVARVQSASKKNLQHYHYGAFRRFAFYNGAWALGKVAPAALYRQLDWLYSYNPIRAVRSYS